jgi:hypothetical protein
MASKKEKLEKASCLLHHESLSLSGEPIFHAQTQQSKAKQTNKLHSDLLISIQFSWFLFVNFDNHSLERLSKLQVEYY